MGLVIINREQRSLPQNHSVYSNALGHARYLALSKVYRFKFESRYVASVNRKSAILLLSRNVTALIELHDPSCVINCLSMTGEKILVLGSLKIGEYTARQRF